MHVPYRAIPFSCHSPSVGASVPSTTVAAVLTVSRITTFSPDSRFIAYSSDRLGNADIWVQPVGGGDPVQVTRSPAQDTQPAWSPDGSSLVFRSERDGGGLYIVPALGGVERQLTSFGTNPSWSPGTQRSCFFKE
jgi:Tol biopolymer transport system component